MEITVRTTNSFSITAVALLAVVTTCAIITIATTTTAKATNASAGRTATRGSKAMLARLRPQKAVLFVCDVQERFRPIIYKSEALIGRSALLVSACRALKIPTIVTEQVPRVFGATVKELGCTHGEKSTAIFEKKRFSMLTPEVEAHLGEEGCVGRDQVLICGIEAHVCVLQTVLDILEHRPESDVFVVADAVSSQRETDRLVALERCVRAGAQVTTAESALFELMGTADHPDFKTVSMLLKEANAGAKEWL